MSYYPCQMLQTSYYILWHTHPRGTMKPSSFDLEVLINNSQKRSIIYPRGNKRYSFTPYSDYIKGKGKSAEKAAKIIEKFRKDNPRR